MIEEQKISLKHIKLMSHAIGFEKERMRNKNYLAYRNYYATPFKEKPWEELVDIDFAMRIGHERKEGTNDYITYMVTPRGLKYLSILYMMNISD